MLRNSCIEYNTHLRKKQHVVTTLHHTFYKRKTITGSRNDIILTLTCFSCSFQFNLRGFSDLLIFVLALSFT